MERPERSITEKWWWQIALIFLGLFGFFFVNALAMESRVSKLETLTSVSIANIEKSIGEIKDSLKKDRI